MSNSTRIEAAKEVSAGGRLEINLQIGHAKIDARAIELLESIRDCGQFTGACLTVAMHPTVARKLLKEISKGLGEHVVDIKMGGSQRGSTHLTSRGAQLAEIFRRIEHDVREATQADLTSLRVECEPLDLPPFKKWRTVASLH